jgi:acetoin utilization protein AcuC
MKMRQVFFLASPAVWEHGHGPNHPLKPIRLQRTYELLEEYGAFRADNVRVVEPRHATAEELALFHTPEYVDVVRALGEGDSTIPAHRYGFGPGDNPVFAGMYDSERLKVGSALQAAELLVQGEGDVAFSYSGGLHHGGPDFASGFCVFNDAAVAIHWLLSQGLRVAYVDIDVHHGDGVQAAFYDTDQVLTISLHQDGRTLFPGTGFVDETGSGVGEGYSVNVPLPPYTDDETYLRAFNEIVPPLVERFAADIGVTQLGVDTHLKDPLARLALSTHGQEALFQALGNLSPRWLALGGGGYDMDVVPRAWTLAFGVMVGQTYPDTLPAQYRERYGGERLHDREHIRVKSDQVEEIVDNVITAVKDQPALSDAFPQ